MGHVVKCQNMWAMMPAAPDRFLRQMEEFCQVSEATEGQRFCQVIPTALEAAQDCGGALLENLMMGQHSLSTSSWSLYLWTTSSAER